MSSSPAKAVPGPVGAAPTERPPPPQTEALIGQILDGRYRIEAKIGEGGLGTVYRAQHLKLERAVAIKVLKAELRAVPDIRQRFEREVRTLAALSHPNIVTITDYGEAAGAIPYLVMELVEGDELSKLVNDGIAPARALSVVRQILSSLAYAHSCDVVHRDLKPANVIVRPLPDGTDHAVVLDFGLAKFMGDDGTPGHDLTRSGLVVGTPAYLPPEQIGGGAKKADARSDLYAVGLILFELLTGRRPFITEDAAEMLRAHLATRPPSLLEASSPGSRISPALEALVRKALEKQPSDRFSNARAMLEALEALGPRPMERAGGPYDITGKVMSSVEIELDSVTRAAARSGTKPPPPPRAARSMLPLGLLGLGLAFGSGLAVATYGSSEGAVDAASLVPEPVAPGPNTPADPVPLPTVGSAVPETGDDEEVEVTAESEVAEAEVVDPTLDVAPPVDGTSPPAGEGDIVEDPTESRGLAVLGDRPSPRNPWIGRVPRQLVRLRSSHVRGGLSSGELRTLTRYRNEHALDVRPRLLLGHAFVRRGWLTAALDQYERALSLDLGCRGEPDLLAALIRVARTSGLAARASNMIVTAYGSEARQEVDEAIARESDDGARGRLQVLRARLE
jgi:hypothetical protein